MAMTVCQHPPCMIYQMPRRAGPASGGRRTMRRGSDGSHLLRVLGVAFGVAAVIGGTIGQGILRSPGVVAAGVPNAWLIILLWILGGVAALVDSMSTVELAAS